MAVWDLVKDLEIQITDQTAEKLLKRMDQDDWTEVLKDLRSATQDNVDLRQSIDITLAVLKIIAKVGATALL